MKECPILFSGAMVRAVLAGAKTQTRRVIKPQPVPWKANTAFWIWRGSDPFTDSMLLDLCPYGGSGDRLWVRETWDAPPGSDRRNEVAYRADYKRDPAGARWRPSIHMPRWASRITLEVVSVRVERLQDLALDDVFAELGETKADAARRHSESWEPYDVLASLWDSINGKRPGCAWADNPWVWAVEFRRT